MEHYVILVSGPSMSRVTRFAAGLAALLETPAVLSCSVFQSLCGITDKKQFTADRLTKEMVDSALETHPEDHYLIVYGPTAFQGKALRDAASLRVFIDADDLQVTAELTEDAIRSLRGIPADSTADDQGRSKKGSSRIKGIRPLDARKGSLSQEVEDILKERRKELDTFVKSDRRLAEIVIGDDEQVDEASVSIVRFVRRTDPYLLDQRLPKGERERRVDELLKQVSKKGGIQRSLRVKRMLWKAVIKGTLAFKRLMDIIISLTAIILLSPLFLIVGLCIKLTDGGPIFYVQTRVGKQGREFPFPKFRSMVLNADKMKDTLLKQAERVGDVTFKMKKDPRVTTIGRFIRRFSIDELPQVWCVLIGDMSIVGPRPPVPREVRLYTQEDRRRLEVIPGLTGIWQVSGRSDIGFKQQVELDVLYIESHSVWLDIKLILKTIPAVLLGKGAY